MAKRDSKDLRAASNFRKSIHSAYSFVRGVEANKAAGSLTLDHLLSEKIRSLKPKSERSLLDASGKDMGMRPSKYDQIEAMEKELSDAIAKVKAAGNDEAKLRNLGIFEVDAEEDAQ